jgi:glutamate synthase domain-containing protein 3
MSYAVDAKGRDLRSVSQEIKEALSQGPVTVRNAAHLHGLLAGLKDGEVTLQGDSGTYLAVLNDGATIHVEGSAGPYLADNMTRGLVIVEGDADYGMGQYCYGGTIVVRGNVGDFAAVMNKGATIIVEGDVGAEAATYMLAGDLIVAGNAGANLGNYLIRGAIYIGGEWDSLGHNTRLEQLDQTDVDKLRELFRQYGVEVDLASFKKITRLSEKPFYSTKEPARLERPKAPVPAG